MSYDKSSEAGALWTIRLDELRLSLAVGIHGHEQAPQPMLVSLELKSRYDSTPCELGDCVDYEPLTRWLIEVWPNSAHSPLLETKLNELARHIFAYDARIVVAKVALYKQRFDTFSERLGIERTYTRITEETIGVGSAA